jgi:hypothetical protein
VGGKADYSKMSGILAQQLLIKVSQHSMEQNEIMSKEIIHKKLADIKYLASQKKVPKVSLRKEIMHLENQLESVFKLEDMLLKTRKQETARTSALKRQIKDLKKKVTLLHDKDLKKKVATLTHLLGDKLAKHDVVKRAGMINPYPPQPTIPPQGYPTQHHGQIVVDTSATRIKTLEKRIQALREELEINKNLTEIPEEQVKALENQINYMEQKLQEFQGMHQGEGQTVTPAQYDVTGKAKSLAVPPVAVAKFIVPPQGQGPTVVKGKADVKHIMLFGPGDKLPAAEKKAITPAPPPMPVLGAKAPPLGKK